MRTAIAVADYYISRQTMLNRHLELLYGGDTCIVTGRYTGENPFGKPVFARRQKLTVGDIVQAPVALVANRLKHGTSRAPYGRIKRELAEFYRENKVEAILAEFGTQAIAVAPQALELGIPVFTYFRGTDSSKALAKGNIVAAYRKYIPQLAGVISVSQFLLDNLAKYGISNPNAHVIPSGVNTRLFTPGTKPPKSCVAIGRMVEKKAPLTTIRSFTEAAKGHPEARLRMIGGGELLEPAKALVRELGMQDRIELLGARGHEDVRRLLSEAEVFLQHSVTAGDGNTEGLPTAIQEAMACGCIVVSTRHAGIPEAVDDGVNGFMVEEHDADAYTARIKALFDGDRRAEMSAAARRTAEERFDNDMLLHKLEDVMAATVKGLGGR